jgi:hypothetical protein
MLNHSGNDHITSRVSQSRLTMGLGIVVCDLQSLALSASVSENGSDTAIAMTGRRVCITASCLSC